jgi:hypothetical protein
MNPETIYHALASLVSLAIGCYLYFVRFRSYRVDLFRQRMFELRAELFDEADGGLMDFEHPAYGILRTTMNGYIRFAHRLNLWLVIFLVLFTAGVSVPTERSWADITSDLEPEVQEKLERYRRRMAYLAIRQAAIVSPEACIVAIPMLFVIVIILAVRYQLASHREESKEGPAMDSPISQARSSVVTTIDDTAFAYGQGELTLAVV